MAGRGLGLTWLGREDPHEPDRVVVKRNEGRRLEHPLVSKLAGVIEAESVGRKDYTWSRDGRSTPRAKFGPFKHQSTNQTNLQAPVHQSSHPSRPSSVLRHALCASQLELLHAVGRLCPLHSSALSFVFLNRIAHCGVAPPHPLAAMVRLDPAPLQSI